MPRLGETAKASTIGFKGRHKYIWAACPDCGKERWINEWGARHDLGILCASCAIKGERNWNYGGSMRGSQNPSWRGGRNLTVQGYIEVNINPDDFFYPMAHTKSKGSYYILEHRLVMAKHLRRCLLPWEIVHHKNGIKTDNRLENLQLLPNRAYHISDSQLKQLVRKLQKENQVLRRALVCIKP